MFDKRMMKRENLNRHTNSFIKGCEINVRNNYLSMENSLCIKGILAICVLLCHLFGNTFGLLTSCHSNIFYKLSAIIFFPMGYLSVSMFFFLTGYGLMSQYKAKPDYLKKYPVKKIIPFYLLCVFLILIYSVYYLLFFKNLITLSLFIKSFFFGKTLIGYGWYLQAILVIYIMFYFVFSFFRHKSDSIKILIFGLFLVAYCILCILLKIGSIWYEGIFCVLLGMMWKMYEEFLNKKLYSKLRLLKSLAFLFAFGATHILASTNIFFSNKNLKLGFKMFSIILFCITILSLLRYIKINFAVTRFLGKYSLEIYVLQYIFIVFYHSDYINIKNYVLYFIFVIVSTLLMSIVTHPLFNKILRYDYNKIFGISRCKDV